MKHYYHKNNINRRFDPETDVIPEGFIPGRFMDPEKEKIRKAKLAQSKSGKIACHIPGTKTIKYIDPTEPIPAGFVKGGLPQDEAHKQITSRVHKGKILSKETKEKISLNHKGGPRKGHEVTQETREKISKHNKGNMIAWNKGLSKYTDERLMKISIEKTGRRGHKQSKEAIEKCIESKRKNNTLNSSKQEDIYYQFLVSLYDPSDIFKQYKDKQRYPFYCDFYIKSEDLFIELNLHWTHGKKLFDPTDKECLKILNEWEEKALTSDFYKAAINTWTVRDVNKYTIAKNNKLNYKVIYPEEYEYYTRCIIISKG